MILFDRFKILEIIIIIIFITFIGCSNSPVVTPSLDTNSFNRSTNSSSNGPINAVQPSTTTPSSTNSSTISPDNSTPDNKSVPRAERTPFQ